MNQFNGIGRLTADVELKTTQSNIAMASGTIAIRRDHKNAQGEYDTDFIRFKAFRKTAEFLSQYTSKGHQVGLNGSWQTGSFEAKDGSKVYTNDLVVQKVTLIEPKNSNAQSNNNSGYTAPSDIDTSVLPF